MKAPLGCGLTLFIPALLHSYTFPHSVIKALLLSLNVTFLDRENPELEIDFYSLF